MHTAQFVIPPSSPLQSRLPAKTPGLVLTVAVILAAHLVLLGSLLTRGWMRGRTTAEAQDEIGVSLPLVTANSAMAQARGESKEPVTSANISTQSLTPPPPTPRTQPVIPAPAAITSTIYVIKSGDTLTKIAKLHSTTVNAIRVAGELQSDRIAVGQKIRLPATAYVSANGRRLIADDR